MRTTHVETQKRHWKAICVWNTGMEVTSKVKEMIIGAVGVDAVGSVSKKSQLDGRLRFEIYVQPEKLKRVMEAMKNDALLSRWWIRESIPLEQRMRRMKKVPYPKPIVMTWNVCGLGAKKHAVEEYVTRKAPMVIMLQETRRRVGKHGMLRFDRYREFETRADPNVEHSLGVAMLVRMDAGLAMERISCGELDHFMIAVKTRGLRKRLAGRTVPAHLLFVCVYVPHVRVRQRKVFYEKLYDLRRRFPECEMIVGGDFNATPDVLEFHLGDSALPRVGLFERAGTREPTAADLTRHNHDLTPATIVDYIITSDGIGAPEIRVDQKCVESDHFPVMATWKRRKDIMITKQAFVRPVRMIPRRCNDVGERIRTHNFWQPLADELDLAGAEELNEVVDKFNTKAWEIATSLRCTTECEEEKTSRRRFKHLPLKVRKAMKREKRAAKRFRDDPTPEKREKWQERRKKKRSLLRKAAKARARNYRQAMAECIQENDMANGWRLFRMTYPSSGGPTREKLTDPNTGAPVDSPEREAELWIEHFEHLAEDDRHSRDPAYWEDKRINRYATELPGINEEVKWQEIVQVIKNLGRRKSPGKDGIIAEFLFPVTQDREQDGVLKNAMEKPLCPMGKVIKKLVRLVWQTGRIPQAWQTAIVVPIPKKGDLTLRDNYRGISLVSAVSKIVTSIVAKRVQAGLVTANRICREQSGFINQEEAVGQATCLFEILRRRQEAKKKTWLCFIDFQKAYDSVPHEAMFKTLDAIGIRGKMFDLIKDMYLNAKMCCRRADGGFSEVVDVLKGVQQGNPSSSILFNAFLNGLLNAKMRQLGVHLDPKILDGQATMDDTKKIAALLYADDVVLISHSPKSLAKMMDEVTKWSDEWGMRINAAKCGVMEVKLVNGGRKTGGGATFKIPSDEAHQTRWTMQGQEIPVVEEYVYLGTTLNDVACPFAMQKARAESADRTRKKLETMLCSPRVPILAKISVIRSVLIPKYTYGCEIWAMHTKYAKYIISKVSTAMRQALGTHQRVPVAPLWREMRTRQINITMACSRTRLYIKASTLRGRLRDVVEYRDNRLPNGGWAKHCKEWLSRKGFWDEIDAIRTDGGQAKVSRAVEVVRTRMRELAEQKDRVASRRATTYFNGPVKFSRDIHRLMWERMELNFGITLLMKYRVGARWTASEFASFPPDNPLVSKEWLKYCPFCGCKTPDTDRHAIVACSYWNDQRKEAFAGHVDEMEDADGEERVAINSGIAFDGLTKILGKKVNYWKKALKGVVNKRRRAQKPQEKVSREKTIEVMVMIVKFLDSTGFMRRSVFDGLIDRERQHQL